jgi:hypothetical protein
MTKHSPFRYFKTSPEVIRLTLLLGSTEFYADAAFSTLRAHAAGKPNSQFGLIVLKNSCLIEWSIADSIPLLIGGFGDDGTKAGGASGAVL